MRIVPAAGAVITDGDGRVLLVQRVHPPDAGKWSVPGGRVDPGETTAEAAAREVREETGLEVAVGAVVGRLRIPGPDDETVYDVVDHAATIVGGTPEAADDAGAVRWFGRDELAGIPVTADLVEILTVYGAFDPG
ncbi:MAG: NUDIX domain-containing protein [Acidothermales bacterium]|nr:NUDIX domain-containing protein [Acidothermales bacterium]